MNPLTCSTVLLRQKLGCVYHNIWANRVVQRRLISSIKDDSTVQTGWSPLIGAIDEDDDAQELLGAIVELWVTIRGHLLTATWLKDYKKATKKSVKKSKRLRKSIKEHSDNM